MTSKPKTSNDFDVISLDLNDSHFVSAIMLVSKYPPFLNYSFRLMLIKIIDQLRFKTNVSVVHQGKLVGYAGWINVNELEAERWQRDGGEIPMPNWENGKASIVTITVSEENKYLLPLMRAIKKKNVGKKIYAIRSFLDGREAQRRPAIVGREYTA
jgi:hemolysin-activating ACP:hemolysin acyltransferase